LVIVSQEFIGGKKKTQILLVQSFEFGLFNTVGWDFEILKIYVELLYLLSEII